MGAVSDAIKACNWDTLKAMDAASFANHVKVLQTDDLSAAAINMRISAVKSFSRWLLLNHRQSIDVLSSVKQLNAKADKRRVRRAASDEELRELLDHVRKAGETLEVPKAYRVNGKLKVGRRRYHIRERALLYMLALGSGLRLSEIRSLSRQSFRFDGDTPLVVVRACYSKRRREDAQPIREDLAAQLLPFIESLEDQEQPWPCLPESMAPLLRADLLAARSNWIAAATSESARAEREKTDFLAVEDSEGRVLDFHALRHTFITRLASANITPKMAQELARHSSITLTMDRYAHTVLADQSRALEALPSIQLEAESVPMTLSATGTDGQKRAAPAQRSPHPAGLRSAPRGTSIGKAQGSREHRGEARKSLTGQGVGIGRHRAAPPEACETEKATSGTRTPDLSFTKAPLYRLS